MANDTRAGRAMFADLLGTLHLTMVPMCAKCLTRSRLSRLEKLQEELRELFDLVNVPVALHGHPEDGAGYRISQLGKR